MVQPFTIAPVGGNETRENYLTNLSRVMKYNLELWDLTRREKLKPSKMPDGRSFSSDLWKRFFNTSRTPGEDFDEIQCHFKTGLLKIAKKL